jgi:hypothetical protein
MTPHLIVEKAVLPEMGHDADPKGKPGVDGVQKGAARQQVAHFDGGLPCLGDDSKTQRSLVLARGGRRLQAQDSQNQEEKGSGSGQRVLRTAD